MLKKPKITRTYIKGAIVQSRVQEIIELCRFLHDKNYLAAADGNVSLRLDEDRIIITPTRKNKRYLKPHEMAMVDINGEVISGQPSSEVPLHLQIYNTIPEAKCIIHAHPSVSIAWTVARPQDTHLPIESISELILGLGHVPIVPYARPGSEDLGVLVAKACTTSRVAIMARHGVVSWGENMTSALNGIDRVEHAATILKAALAIGGITPLPRSEIEALYAMRESSEGGAT